MIKTNIKGYDKLPLSACWHSTHRMTSTRLSFFGKGITCIDRLDNVPLNILHSIRQLDLSHNAISKLENIRQFPNLEVVNLAHNHIIDGKQILKLSKLNKLKVLMIKGNPFLKSGQNKDQAIKFLLPLQTDIQPIPQHLQQQLSQIITKYSWKQIKQQYLRHIGIQIELVTQFNFQLTQQSMQQTYNRIINTIATSHVQDILQCCRKEVVGGIIVGEEGGEEEDGGLEKWLEKWLENKIEDYDGVLEREIRELDQKIDSQEQILSHVRMMRRQKRSRQKQNPIQRLKKQSKPILSLRQPTQNTSKIKLRKSPQRKQNNFNSYSSTVQQRQKQRQRQKEEQSTKKASQQVTKKQLEQKFETYYNSMLTKTNPVYQLLYSPLHSLKSKQKDMLIQTLSAHLKERSFAAFKAERIKEEYHQLSRRQVQKDVMLKASQKKFVELKIGTTQIITNLEREIEDRDNLIENLKVRLEQMTSQKLMMSKRIEYLEQQVSQSKLKIIKQNNQLDKHKQDDQYFQLIKTRNQQQIKRQYLTLLNKSAQRLSKFRTTQQQHHLIENKNLMKKCFGAFKKEREIKILSNNVGKLILNNRVKQFADHAQFQVSAARVKKCLKKRYEESFMRTWMQVYCYWKDMKSRLGKFQGWHKKMRTKLYFGSWKTQSEHKTYEHNLQKAIKFHTTLLKSKYVKNWQIYNKLPIYQQAQLSVDLKTKRIHRFLSLLSTNLTSNTLLHNKFLNLIIYKNKTCRLHNFIRFRNYAVGKSQLRSYKEKKLMMSLKINYFYEFVRVAMRRKCIREEEREKEGKLIQLRKRNMLGRFHCEENCRKVRVGRFRRIADIYRQINIGKSLKQSLKQFMIQDKITKNSLKTFFQNLQLHYLTTLKSTNKNLQLQLLLHKNITKQNKNRANKKQFFHILMQPQRNKKKLIQYLNNKYYKLMVTYFHNWKVEVLKEKVGYLKNRIHQFGPEIQEISKRQKTVFEEKLVLMNIIENKEKTIKGFVKQLQQAEYTIKTKEDKYQKLKQFLHEAGEDVTVLGSKVQPSILAPERDFDTFLEQERTEYFNSFRKF